MTTHRIAPRPACIAVIAGLVLTLSGCITINSGDGGGFNFGGSCPDGSFAKEVTGGEVSNLEFDGNWDVQVTVGDPQSVAVSGDVPEDSVKAEIVGSTLTLQSTCAQQSRAEVVVETFSQIKVVNGASARSSAGSIGDVTIDVANSASLDMTSIEALEATVGVDNSGRVGFTATDATVNANNGARIDFTATDASVTMANASNGAAVVSGTLNVDMTNGSNLTYSGGGTLGTQNVINGSNLTPG